MAHGIVIIGLTDGDWLTLTTPGTPIEEAKQVYRQIKTTGGEIDGVAYDEVRQYTQRGCQRLRFKGKGIVAVNVTHPTLEDDEDAALVVVANKKELQAALGLGDDAFKELWGAKGRPERDKAGYVVAEFEAFANSQGIIMDTPEDTGTGKPE